MAASSSSSPSPGFHKECCPRSYGPKPRPRPPPPPPRPDNNVTEREIYDDEGVSDDEDVCFCIPFPWLLEYHREQMGNPDLTEAQLWKHFRDANKAAIEEDDPDFNIDDWDTDCPLECSQCFLAAKGSPRPHYQNRCIVTGLSKDTSMEELDELFSRAGNIVESKILKDTKTGESRGYGFVSFEYHKSMFDAIRLLNGHVLKGQSLTVFECQQNFSPGTKDRSRDDVPPPTKDDHALPGTKDSKDDGGAAYIELL